MHHNFEARKKTKQKFSWAVVVHRTSGGPSAQEAEAAGSTVQVPAQSGYTEKHCLETRKCLRSGWNMARPCLKQRGCWGNVCFAF